MQLKDDSCDHGCTWCRAAAVAAADNLISTSWHFLCLQDTAFVVALLRPTKGSVASSYHGSKSASGLPERVAGAAARNKHACSPQATFSPQDKSKTLWMKLRTTRSLQLCRRSTLAAIPVHICSASAWWMGCRTKGSICAPKGASC
jgi:hypothetical protein